MPGPDWIYHPLGALLALAGGLWLLWSLFLSGRARGKPRCPKCWYDMTGAKGLTCPECGKTPKSPRGLLKTRRKYFEALAALLVLLLAYSAWEVPRIKRYGWPCALPNWALIALYPIVDPPPNNATPRPIHDELRDRLAADRLGAIDRWMLSTVVSDWIDAAAANSRHDEAVRMLTQCDTAPPTVIEKLLKLASEYPGNNPTLAALARVAICDSRTQNLIDQRLRDSPTLSLGDILRRAPRTEKDAAAWRVVIERYFQPPDWNKVYSCARSIALLGPTARSLVPALRSARASAEKQHADTHTLDCAIAVVSGESESDAEYWSRRLPFDEGALTGLLSSRGAWTTETVANIRGAIESPSIHSRPMLALSIEIESHTSECGDLIPVLRDKLGQNQSDAVDTRLKFLIDHLTYPW